MKIILSNHHRNLEMNQSYHHHNFEMMHLFQLQELRNKALSRLLGQITEQRRALKGYTKSYELSFESATDPLVQLQRTRSAIGRKFHTIVQQMKGF